MTPGAPQEMETFHSQSFSRSEDQGRDERSEGDTKACPGIPLEIRVGGASPGGQTHPGPSAC